MTFRGNDSATHCRWGWRAKAGGDIDIGHEYLYVCSCELRQVEEITSEANDYTWSVCCIP